MKLKKTLLSAGKYVCLATVISSIVLTGCSSKGKKSKNASGSNAGTENQTDAKEAFIADGQIFENPNITVDAGMQSGQVVTWKCVYFGSYPQSEVTAEDPVYEQLLAATDWDENGNLILGEERFKRISKADSKFIDDEVEEGYYTWDDQFHYFRYEPVKWRVLSVNEDVALLLSDVILDDQIYYENYMPVTWETSTIRGWLNGCGPEQNAAGIDYSVNNFINAAFNADELTAIHLTDVENKGNISHGTDGGNVTADYVFLLSESEVYTNNATAYGFAINATSNDEARRAGVSDYARAKGVITDPNASSGYWWLRSAGESADFAVDVDTSGVVNTAGIGVDEFNDGVRPALNFNLESAGLCVYAGTVSSNGEITQ